MHLIDVEIFLCNESSVTLTVQNSLCATGLYNVYTNAIYLYQAEIKKGESDESNINFQE